MIDIKYPNGQMQIDLENFFPASRRNCKRLLAIIDMDLQHRDELLQTIRVWLMDERNLCEHHAKEYANKYIEIKPRVRDVEARVKSLKVHMDSIAAWKRTPEYNQVKDKFKEVQKEYRHLKNIESSYDSSSKQYHGRKEKLQKNIEYRKEFQKKG